MRTIEWKDGVVVTIDQTRLPNQTVAIKMRNCNEVADAIKTMKIRGAPLLGAAAAYGLALTAFHSKAKEKDHLMKELAESAQALRETRPTAMNLFWAIDRVIEKGMEAEGDRNVLVKAVIEEAHEIAEEDVIANRKIGEHGSKLIEDGDTVLTHCNAGSLATVDYGTALGVVRAAYGEGKDISVLATETRPLLQGARLTTYELSRDGIPVTLITDNMVGYVMSKGLVDKVVVGADRVVSDAVFNKIGTYTIAVLAHEHGIPFYVAAPRSTFNMSQRAREVVIEERRIEEVVRICGVRITPKSVFALNPAFDVTPLGFVTAIISEEGVVTPKDIAKLPTR